MTTHFRKKLYKITKCNLGKIVHHVSLNGKFSEGKLKTNSPRKRIETVNTNEKRQKGKQGFVYTERKLRQLNTEKLIDHDIFVV